MMRLIPALVLAVAPSGPVCLSLCLPLTSGLLSLTFLSSSFVLSPAGPGRFFFFFFFISLPLSFEAGSPYRTQAGLKLRIFLPQLPLCWDYTRINFEFYNLL